MSWPPLANELPEFAVALPVDFRGFHELYAEPYLRLAHLQLGSRREAEDVVGTTFYQLALHWPHVKRQESTEAFGWAVLKQLLGERREELGLGSALVQTAAFAAAALKGAQEQFAVLEGKLGLYAAISRLPERQCDVIVLRYVLGYPDAHTARIMGVTEATVRSNVRFARRRLARDLNIDWSVPTGGE
jgi:RNA polymerase sigma-70 factor (ECF subfamily)